MIAAPARWSSCSSERSSPPSCSLCCSSRSRCTCATWCTTPPSKAPTTRLADTTPEEGIERTRDVISRAVGADYAEDIRIGVSGAAPYETVDVRVRTTFPLLGLIGLPLAMEVEAHAPAETFGEE